MFLNTYPSGIRKKQRELILLDGHNVDYPHDLQ